MESNVREHLDRVMKHLEHHFSLADCHTVDYFTKNLYTLIPSNISKEIEGNIELALETFLNGTPSQQMPAINSYITLCKSMALYNKNVCLSLDEFKEELIDRKPSLEKSDFSSLKLDVFMSKKKSYEVEICSGIATALTKATNATHIVDVGDGKGYLSSMLALNHDIRVLGLDCSQTNTVGAVRRAEKLGRVWRGITKKTYTERELYKQATTFVDEHTNLSELVSDVFDEGECGDLGLVGLHTCGDLGPNCLRIYQAQRQLKFVCNVSCCYNLIQNGFPMSGYLEDKEYRLNGRIRMLSAQSIDRILNKGSFNMKICFYRAVFQVLLEKYGVQLSENRVGKCKKTPDNFIQYVCEMKKKMGLTLEVSDEELKQLETFYSQREGEMRIFFLIRSMLAPAVESLILLDRVLYLLERGYRDSFLVKLFDPVISPRCYGIVSFKPT